MSGGAFGYLCDNANGMYPEPYERMAEVMSDWPDAQLKIQRIAILLRQALVLHAEMADVMHDVEWWKSFDYTKDQVTEGVEAWREKRNSNAE